MSERNKHTAFLKRLLGQEHTKVHRQMQDDIHRAEKNEKCARSAMMGVAIIALLSGCGLCYEAVFVTDFFQNPTHFLTRLFAYLGLGSSLCWMVFLACWLWYRALTDRLYEDCRRLLGCLQKPHIWVLGANSCPETGHVDGTNRDALTASRSSMAPLSQAA